MRTTALLCALLLPAWCGAQTVTRTVAYEYDAFGQLIRETIEPNGDINKTKIATIYTRDADTGVVTLRQQAYRDPQTGTDVLRDVETLIYDPRKRYATTVTNAKQHNEVRAFDEATGNVLSLTGPNQLSTSWDYDGWGRKVKETRADGSSTTWAYRQCIDTCLNSAVSVTITRNWFGTQQTTVPGEEFTDVLGRKVLTRGWGFDGQAVLKERTFDAKGRLVSASQPYFAGSAAIWTYLGHDDLGRVTQVQSPNDTGTYETSTLQYDGTRLIHTNAKGQKRAETRNALGKLKNVTDDDGYTTSYVYDGFANLLRTTDPKGNQITVGYDNLGRKTQLADPDLGTWTYAVNPLGQTYSQTDAKNQTTVFSFDELGRMVRRLNPDQDGRWEYDSATKGKGQLAEAYTWVAGAKDYRRIYSYDNLGRPASTTISLDWDYVEEYGYDSFGRANATTYRRNAKGGSGGPFNTVTKLYNAQGYASQQQFTSNSGSGTIWTAVASDAQGRVTQEQLGNGLVRRKTYNGYTGHLTGIATGANASNASQQDDGYGYDSLGNLTSRTQLISTAGAPVSETFSYDGLNRMTSSQVNGQGIKRHAYDSIGNLVSKDDAAVVYTYPASGVGSVGPHALASIDSPELVAGQSNPEFGYDANGNLVDGLGRHYGWTSFDQPATIDKLSGGSAIQRTAFFFNPEQQRIRQTVRPVSRGVPGPVSRTIYYAGVVEKEIDAGNNTTTVRTYVGAEIGYLEEKFVGVAVAPSASAPRDVRYLLGDHLGSTVAVLDQNQAVLQRMSYDPWGRRRNTDGSDDTNTSLGSIVNGQNHTGYTGQEQLDQLGLVHLNGRVYDPITGRMTSADPTVPDPSDTQHLNRYAYVLNNALAFVDPSGFGPVATSGFGWDVVYKYNPRADGSPPDITGSPTSQTPACSSACDKAPDQKVNEEEAKKREIERKARVAAAKTAADNEKIKAAWLNSPNRSVVQAAACVGLEGTCATASAAPLVVGVLASPMGRTLLALLGVNSAANDEVALPLGGVASATKGLPPLRLAYLEAVEELRVAGQSLRAAGGDTEQIARMMHAQRRAIGEEFKAMTPPDELAKIYARNIEKYGDKLGPTVDFLQAKGKSWDQIIESAGRAGGKDLGY